MCTDVYWCGLICDEVYWCVLMCTDVHWCVFMCNDVLMRVHVYWCILICVLMCTDVYWCLLICADAYWRVLMCADVWCYRQYTTKEPRASKQGKTKQNKARQSKTKPDKASHDAWQECPPYMAGWQNKMVRQDTPYGRTARHHMARWQYRTVRHPVRARMPHNLHTTLVIVQKQNTSGSK